MKALNLKYIIIPNPSKTQWFFFIFLLGALLQEIIPEKLKKLLEFKDVDDEGKEGEALLKYKLTQAQTEILLNTFVCLTMVFPHFYYTTINKKAYEKRKQETLNNINQNKHLMNIKDRKNKAFIYLFIVIFIISFVDVLAQLLHPIEIIREYILCDKHMETDFSHFNSILFIDIFGRYFFSRCLLKTQFYLHHKISLFLNIFGIIFIILAEKEKMMENINEYESTYYYFFLLNL